MRFALSLLGILIATAAFGTPAHADGPRCAFYNGRFGGASNCGFHNDVCATAARPASAQSPLSVLKRRAALGQFDH